MIDNDRVLCMIVDSGRCSCLMRRYRILCEILDYIELKLINCKIISISLMENILMMLYGAVSLLMVTYWMTKLWRILLTLSSFTRILLSHKTSNLISNKWGWFSHEIYVSPLEIPWIYYTLCNTLLKNFEGVNHPHDSILRYWTKSKKI